MTGCFPFLLSHKKGMIFMPLYTYDGPVLKFNVCVDNRWKGRTEAPTEAKAKNNLAFQYKKQNKMTPNTIVTLPGKLVLVERGEL